MACFRRSGMQWGVGETESGQKKAKQNKTKKQKKKEGKKREKIEMTRKREGNGEQGGRVFSCFDYLFAPSSSSRHAGHSR